MISTHDGYLNNTAVKPEYTIFTKQHTALPIDSTYADQATTQNENEHIATFSLMLLYAQVCVSRKNACYRSVMHNMWHVSLLYKWNEDV